jgi:hypothetical protein
MDKNEEKIKADQKKQQVVAENNKKAPPCPTGMDRGGNLLIDQGWAHYISGRRMTALWASMEIWN